jgi:hypothetical protein
MGPEKIACSLALMQFRDSLHNAFRDASLYFVKRSNHDLFETGEEISMVDKVKFFF